MVYFAANQGTEMTGQTQHVLFAARLFGRGSGAALVATENEQRKAKPEDLLQSFVWISKRFKIFLRHQTVPIRGCLERHSTFGRKLPSAKVVALCTAYQLPSALAIQKW